MRAFISASLIPLFAKSNLSASSDKKSEARTIERCNARKMKNCSGSAPLTLATPHFLLDMTNLNIEIKRRQHLYGVGAHRRASSVFTLRLHQSARQSTLRLSSHDLI